MAATITITGNISQTPKLETIKTDDGPTNLCRLNIGYTINRGRNDKNFIEATTWGDAATNHAKHLTKGSHIRIDGELSYETWETNDGTKRSRHRIINATIEYLTPNTKPQPPTQPPTEPGQEEPF